MLAIANRLLMSLKHYIEARWKDQAWNRRFIVVANRTPLAERIEKDSGVKQGILTANGVEENVRVVHAATRGAQPWRFSTDLPRAALVTALAGLTYLL